MTLHRRGIRGGNLPELIEAAEVIEPDVVAVARRPAQALDPPFVAVLFHHIPTIERIAPALPGLAEKVRWNARYYFHFTMFVQAKKFGMSPNVGTVIVHEDGDVADHANAPLGTITPQGLPLLKERELN